MASEVDICNLALARLGDDATVASIDPPEGSAQAYHCARFYPMARDTMLDMHNWSFATTRARLALLDITLPDAWAYAYARPSSAVKLISVLEDGASEDGVAQQFEHEILTDGTRVIYTNVEDAWLRYTVRPTDPTVFSPLFVDALSMLLASHLAGTLIKGADGAAMSRQWLQFWRATMGAAVNADASQRHIEPTHTPTWMASR